MNSESEGRNCAEQTADQGSLKETLGDIVSARLRPWVYRSLSRRVKASWFDPALSLVYTGRTRLDCAGIAARGGRFLFDACDRRATIDLMKSDFPSAAERVIEEADLAVEHVFDCCGSGPVRLGAQIDWHADFRADVRWPAVFYRDVVSVNPDGISDIKVPWELSRFQHLNALGIAYWLTREERYARECVAQVVHWIEHNPPRRGPNWCRAMEVGIRVVNWTSAYGFFAESPAFTPEARRLLFESMRAQLFFIYHNLEVDFRLRSARLVERGNHYVFDLVGLALPLMVFPGLLPKRILRDVLRRLARECLAQVTPDGVHGELAPGYHALVAEALLCTLLVAERNGIGLAPCVRERTVAMLDFISAFMKPDGNAPSFRDADDGRLVRFTGASHDRLAYLLNVGAAHFGHARFKSSAPDFRAESLWWVGREGLEAFSALPAAHERGVSTAFPLSGFFFMRNAGDYLGGVCARVGGDLGSHGHNDALSFELVADGRPVLVDSGTYAYTVDADTRDLFRSTAYHNTLMIDGKEINSLPTGAPFRLEEEAFPRLERWRSGKECDVAVASHRGYRKADPSIVHRRMFIYDRLRRRWRIIDHVRGGGVHGIRIFFHFAQGLEPRADEPEGRIVLYEGNTPVFRIGVAEPREWQMDLSEGWVSPAYGVKVESWIACYSRTLRLPLRVAFDLERVE